MKIKFIGAVGGDVTGSCILCCARNGTRFLVDCGIFQGGGFTETKNARFPFDPKSIDFVLLTHAHADHCGRIPNLYECGFAGKIICSKVTRDLVILNIMDMLGKEGVLPESDKLKAKAQEAWKKKFTTEEQIPKIGTAGQPFFIDNDVQISMLRSSHFLGSTSFTVGWNVYREGGDIQGEHQSKTICFSGDLGGVIDSATNHLPLLKDGFAPWVNTDYIVMESTYGTQTREHEYKDFDKRIARLDELISAGDADILVFACFSMQRTQDILFDLLYLAMRDKKHCFAITLDSPMGIKACQIYSNALKQTKTDNKGGEKFIYLNTEFMDRFCYLLGEDYMNRISEGCDRKIHAMRKFISEVLSARFEHDNVAISFKDTNKDQLEQIEEDPMLQSEKKESKEIYITSSGMLQNGRVLDHIQKRHGDERTAFFITGFCKSTVNGKTMSAWSKNPDSTEGTIICDEKGVKKIDRAKWKAKIHNIAPYYSGHADVDGLLRFLLCSTKHGKGEGKKIVIDKKQITVFLNHGETRSRAMLKNKIEEESKKPENQEVREIKEVVLPNATDPFFDLDSGEWDTNPNDLLAPVFTVPVEKLADASKKQKKEKNKNSNG